MLMRNLKVVADCTLLLLLCLCASSLLPAHHAQSQRPTPVPVKFDEFKYTDDKDQEAHLDRFAAELKRQPRTRGFIIGYSDPLFRYGDLSALQIAGYAKLDLVYRRDNAIDWDRIVKIDGGYREERMIELYLVPPGAPAPVPRPTLQPAQVTFCPLINVSGQLFVWDTKQPLTFSAWVREEMTKTVPTYVWTVSHGEISSGQGTKEIVVQQSGTEYRPVTATVEIGGYAPACEVKVSAASPEKLISVPLKFDEFGNVPSGDMKARLDNYALGIQNTPEMLAYIIFYGGRLYNGRPGRRDEADKLAARLKNYLLNTRGIEPERLLMINGGFREEWTAELWLSPRGVKPPPPTPTIQPGEIKFQPERRRRRRRA